MFVVRLFVVGIFVVGVFVVGIFVVGMFIILGLSLAAHRYSRKKQFNKNMNRLAIET